MAQPDFQTMQKGAQASRLYLHSSAAQKAKMAILRFFTRDQHPDLRGEARDKNANFTWVQHMLHHLAPNGSMSSNSSGEGDIRRALIEADLVESAKLETAIRANLKSLNFKS